MRCGSKTYEKVTFPSGPHHLLKLGICEMGHSFNENEQKGVQKARKEKKPKGEWHSLIYEARDTLIEGTSQQPPPFASSNSYFISSLHHWSSFNLWSEGSEESNTWKSSSS